MQICLWALERKLGVCLIIVSITRKSQSQMWVSHHTAVFREILPCYYIPAAVSALLPPSLTKHPPRLLKVTLGLHGHPYSV